MKDNELKKIEKALSARQEMEELIFRLNELLFLWNEELSFMKKKLAVYEKDYNDSKISDQSDNKEELVNYGWYYGSAKAVDKNITMLKKVVKEYENKLSKGR